MLCPLRSKYKGMAAGNSTRPNVRPRIEATPQLAYDLAMAAYAGVPTLITQREPGWIYKPSWDLPLLIGSAILVPVPFLMAWAAESSGWMGQQQAIDVINLVVAALVGGPDL